MRYNMLHLLGYIIVKRCAEICPYNGVNSLKQEFTPFFVSSLTYYPGYRDNTREALGIYIFVKRANQQERDFNIRMMKKAEILRNRLSANLN